MANVPLRTASDLARHLGIQRQRLHPYVQRALVEPVRVEGRKRLYDAGAQREIVWEYVMGWEADSYHPDVDREPRQRLMEVLAEFDLEVPGHRRWPAA